MSQGSLESRLFSDSQSSLVTRAPDSNRDQNGTWTIMRDMARRVKEITFSNLFCPQNAFLTFFEAFYAI